MISQGSHHLHVHTTIRGSLLQFHFSVQDHQGEEGVGEESVESTPDCGHVTQNVP
jgi:hypothetical protein